ncbi:hypothetical protein CLU79DRAFT_780977 [Phycomyces nitens]|nr:hypothetical protein CLU79DRAFT_780977 [Phycomyces nitens]
MSNFGYTGTGGGRMLVRDNQTSGTSSNRVLRSQAKAIVAPSPSFMNPSTTGYHDTSAPYLSEPNMAPMEPLLNRTSTIGDRKPTMAPTPSKPFHLMNSTRLYDDF